MEDQMVIAMEQFQGRPPASWRSPAATQPAFTASEDGRAAQTATDSPTINAAHIPSVEIGSSDAAVEPMPIPASTAAAATQTGIMKTFYKRHLPSPPATAFSSQEGKCCAILPSQGQSKLIQ